MSNDRLFWYVFGYATTRIEFTELNLIRLVLIKSELNVNCFMC